MNKTSVHKTDRYANIRMNSSIALSASNRQRTGSRASVRNSMQNSTTPQYKPIKVVGQGAFGVVYCARSPEGEIVAVKKVLQDPRYKNRELETMQEIHNEYCVNLRSFFRTAGRKPNEIFLNLVMDFLPMSLHQFNMSYRKERKYPPLLYVKLFAFEMFSGLHYLHSIGITHRDLKPQNALCDPASGELKICDFGSAKRLKPDDRSVSYIASRYYRAPELIFDCVHYTTAIDIWAAGCVVAEMLMAGMPIFPGGSSVGQLHEIVKVIGPPTDDDLRSFQHSQNIQITIEKENSLENVLPKHTPPELSDLLAKIFVYNPGGRPTALQCINHAAFDELFEYDMTMPDGRPFPLLNRNPEY